MQEAVAVTTKLQEEIFLEMGVGKSVLLDIVGESVSHPSVYQRRLEGPKYVDICYLLLDL